jgi:hypothetical protein
MRKALFSGILAFLILSLAIQNTGCYYMADMRPKQEARKPKKIPLGFVSEIERGKSIEVSIRDGKLVQGKFSGRACGSRLYQHLGPITFPA